MAFRPLFAALFFVPLCGSLLAGCVVVPNHVSAPTSAGIGQIKLIVPQPQAAANAPRVAYVSALSWNRARLTLTPVDGRAPSVSHLLEDHGDGLQVQDEIGALPPGQYTVKVDLVESASSGSERVVASGLLDGTSAPKFGPGVNNLEVMVHPAQVGTHVAPIASAMWVPHRQTSWHSDSHVVIEDRAWNTATNVAILAATVVQAVADAHHASERSSSSAGRRVPDSDRGSNPYSGSSGSNKLPIDDGLSTGSADTGSGYTTNSTSSGSSDSSSGYADNGTNAYLPGTDGSTSSTASSSSDSSTPSTDNSAPSADSSASSTDSSTLSTDSSSSSDSTNADGTISTGKTALKQLPAYATP
jgi:hypothetical protein